jgi:hypothetical protein
VSDKNETVLVPIEEKQVEFYGDELTAALIQPDDQGQPQIFVPLRPMCDYIGLSFAGQRERINRDPVLSESVRFVRVTRTNTAGGNPNMMALPLKFIPGWLFGISVNRVRPDLREKITLYQRECYDVLWEAFQSGRLTGDSDLMQGDSPAVQAYQLAMAVADLARNQVLMEARLTGRLEEHERRLEEVEATLGDPNRHVSPEQASQISQSVKAVAMKMSARSGRNEYGGVYGELYRKFGITSYKMMPAKRFQEAMDFLTHWHQSLVGDEPF